MSCLLLVIALITCLLVLFVEKETFFKKLGNHLRSCKERNGRDYSKFLSSKTLKMKENLSKLKSMFCPRCHKNFYTYLKNSVKELLILT